MPDLLSSWSGYNKRMVTCICSLPKEDSKLLTRLTEPTWAYHSPAFIACSYVSTISCQTQSRMICSELTTRMLSRGLAMRRLCQPLFPSQPDPIVLCMRRVKHSKFPMYITGQQFMLIFRD